MSFIRTLVPVFLFFFAAGAVQADEKNMQLLQCAMTQLVAGAVAEDATVIRAFLYAENDPDLALVEAHTRRIIASKRFQDAASRVFGDQERAAFRQRYRILNGGDFAYGLLAATWEIKGDTATVQAEHAAELARNEVKLPRLVNRRGVWKLAVTPTPKPAQADVKALAAAITRHAEIVSDVATAIAVGKLTRVDQVEAALREVPQFAPSDFTPDIVLALPPTR